MGKFSSELTRHRALYGFGFLRRESNGRLAAVELLHVDPGVVAALDRADDDARATGIEHRERRRLVATCVRVRVVADDRGVRDAAVDSPVDACEHGGVSEKRTLYSAVLFEVLVSPGTGETSTLIVVGPLKLTAPMCVKTTVFVWPGSITS